ncbi:hypothetical protein FRC17_004486 [Serendipita sp. 399]|nr:hypothetical protein FRC17_004486 [Serendipita sp. 399]
MGSLHEKVAIVTGSSRGIGAAIAVALAKEGARVVVNYVSPSSKSKAEEVAKTIKGLGLKALVVQADLANLEDVDNLVKETVATFGKIDILVNNSAIVQFEDIGNIVSIVGVVVLPSVILIVSVDGGELYPNRAYLRAPSSLLGLT